MMNLIIYVIVWSVFITIMYLCVSKKSMKYEIERLNRRLEMQEEYTEYYEKLYYEKRDAMYNLLKSNSERVIERLEKKEDDK